MNERGGFGKAIVLIISHIFVATLAVLLALSVNTIAGSLLRMGDKPAVEAGYNKLQELENVITDMYIGEADPEYMRDAAANAMVQAVGDRWSYYIPADQMQDHMEQKANAYVGVGITVIMVEDGSGFEIQKVEKGSPALEGGLMPGDIVVAVNGNRVSQVGYEQAVAMVGGEENTDVELTYSRDGAEHTVTLTRKKIMVQVAYGQMVTESIGYIHIVNFDDRCKEETVALIQQLEQEGAQKLIFDVRFNPGGYKHELVALLDYLLPEGILFQSENYLGQTSVDRSDASCKQMPMAVLINGDSYSAAEFFAAALEEYDYAVTVGQPTTGKGYFQSTMTLSDGSAVNLSIGKYYTPKGVSLAEVGGLVPEITVEVDEETAALIYGGLLEVEEDPQIQAAIRALEAQS